MTIQTVNLGSAPTGAGGDTFRSTGTKMNENFTNWAHAASRMVGDAEGNVMEVGAFGLGLLRSPNPPQTAIKNSFVSNTGASGIFPYGSYALINYNTTSYSVAIGARDYPAGRLSYYVKQDGVWSSVIDVRDTRNTTVDGNGFIKAASPVIKLFANKIEANEEAFEQNPTFEKVGVGHYLLKNTEGFSDNGWYIEMPKDANGNVLVAVQYQQLEDDTIEVKTFAKKFDEETGDIVPNFEKPRDIPVGRWIDIRLKALPQPEIKISDTPIDFQPTNLAQAVAEVLRDDSEQ
ncbi:hypothetical protein U4959_10745 [Acinetobacter junii]|uniref:phage tail fiber protein n=1 Tax=Acinetobacter junii TaxID=40215 RepID=UPI002B4C1A4C|nr:hypothetical protein [Acinetobacter junii]WRL34250.1 hypothetical protein U4959_10745 [Acinetobacter junii]